MPDQNLTILAPENAPAIVVNGDGDYGSVNLDSISHAIDLAGTAFHRASHPGDGDTVESLRRDVNELSDALRLLAGEVYQLARGVHLARVSVHRGD